MFFLKYWFGKGKNWSFVLAQLNVNMCLYLDFYAIIKGNTQLWKNIKTFYTTYYFAGKLQKKAKKNLMKSSREALSTAQLKKHEKVYCRLLHIHIIKYALWNMHTYIRTLMYMYCLQFPLYCTLTVYTKK